MKPTYVILLFSLGLQLNAQEVETQGPKASPLATEYVNQEILIDLSLTNFQDLRALRGQIEEVWGPPLKIELGPGDGFLRGKEVRSRRKIHYPLFILHLYTFDTLEYRFSHIEPRTKPFHSFRVGMPFPEEEGEPEIPLTEYSILHGGKTAILRLSLNPRRIIQRIEILFEIE
jgi:hypothetical protein